MTAIRPIQAGVILIASILGACKGSGPAEAPSTAAPSAKPAAAATPAAAPAAKPAEEALVSAAPGPAGVVWASGPVEGVGSVELPSGGKWQKDGLGVANEELDITIMVQIQKGIEPADRADFMSSLIDVNKKDAPKYQVVAQKNGQVANVAAGRVDGKFDNGTAYATRDYVLFTKHGALAIMVRGPVAKEADVQALADHVAASLK